MRLILIMIMIILISSCSNRYKGLHTDHKKFYKDIDYCLKESCKSRTNNVLYNFSIISSVLAYGGGGGGSPLKDKIYYKNFKLCLEEKGYSKDENGIFELPYLNCN